MKAKRILTAFAVTALAAFIAAGMTACGAEESGSGNEGGNGNGGENPPKVELKDSDAPADISWFCDSMNIYVYRAVYGEDETASPYSEYKLDEGEWIPAGESNYDDFEAVFENLTPGSSHTVYARCGEHEGYKASDAIAVDVTLDKAYRSERPEAAEYEVNGKTLTVTLEDDWEISFDNRATYTADGTFTYEETGNKTFYIRYGETDMYYAGSEVAYNVIITDFAGGLGTQDNPYRIETLAQFGLLQTATYIKSEDWFKLTDDIVFDGETLNCVRQDLTLNIDGGGHRIVAPVLSAPLFYNVGTVKNLTVEQAEYTADFAKTETSAALLCWYVRRQLENVSVSGSINLTCNEMPGYSNRYDVSVGGIAVLAGDCRINNCSADINVSLPDTSDGAMLYNLALGGLVASVSRYSTAEISACSVRLNVTGGEIAYGDIGGLVGGLVASSESGPSDRIAPSVTVRDSYAAGSVSIKTVCHVISGSQKQVTRIGGIAPAVCGSIERCYSAIAFDVTADIYRNSMQDYQAEILAGGIVAEGASDGATRPVLSNVFFAGSITVKDVTEESKKGGIFKNVVICVQHSEFDSPSKLYYAEEALSVPEGAEQVSASATDTAVSKTDILSESWQKVNLAWDESVWTFKDGEFPVLKSL